MKNIADHQKYLESFRHYASEHHDSENRVKYTYVWEDTQAMFVKALTKGKGPQNDTLGTLKVMIGVFLIVECNRQGM
jgi:hypothetical protein